MSYSNWNDLCAAAEQWGNPHLSAFIAAERSVAENSENAKAMYRNTALYPGTLQLPGYVDALCRGGGIDMAWNRKNQLLRMGRQLLLRAARVRQYFLVDEAVLTHPPGRWTNLVVPQLMRTIEILEEDMASGDPLLQFLVVPAEATLPRQEQKNIYDDSFALFSVEDTVTGFTDAWRDGQLFPAEGDKLNQLVHTWDQVGKIALSPEASLARVEYTLQTYGS